MPGRYETLNVAEHMLRAAEVLLYKKYGVACSGDETDVCRLMTEYGYTCRGLCVRPAEREADMEIGWRRSFDSWVSRHPDVKRRMESGLVGQETIDTYSLGTRSMDPFYVPVGGARGMRIWREQQKQGYRLWVDGTADIVAISYEWQHQSAVPINGEQLRQYVTRKISESLGRRRRVYFWLDVTSTRCSRESYWQPDCLIPFYVYGFHSLCGDSDRLFPTLEKRMHILGERTRRNFWSSDGEFWPSDILQTLFSSRGWDKDILECLVSHVTVHEALAEAREKLEPIMYHPVLDVHEAAQTMSTREADDMLEENGSGFWNEWREGIGSEGRDLYSSSMLVHSLLRSVRSVWLLSACGTKAMMMDCCDAGASPVALLYGVSHVSPIAGEKEAVKFVVTGDSLERARVEVELLISIAKGLQCWYHWHEIGPHHRFATLPQHGPNTGSSEMRSKFEYLAECTDQQWIRNTARVRVVPGCLAVVRMV